MGAQGATRQARRERRLQEARRKRMTAGGIVLAGIVLVGSAIWLSTSTRASAEAEFDYTPADVSNDSPFQAVHEMGAGPQPVLLPADGPQPKIAVNERFYNFGSIGPSDVVTREFVVANLGESPLTISRAYTTCGCTTADFTASVIGPGQVALITLRFDAGFHDTRGQTVRRGIIIESNDPDRPTAEIWIEAAVRSS